MSTLDAPTAGTPTAGVATAGVATSFAASFAIGARDLLPYALRSLNLHAFPVAEHDLEFDLVPVNTGDAIETGSRVEGKHQEAKKQADPGPLLRCDMVHRGDIVDAVFDPLRFGPPRLAGCVRVEESESTILDVHP